MDPLERFVRDNTEKFNDAMPSNDLWGKINKELPEEDKPGKRFPWLRIAAAIIISLGSIGVYEMVRPHDSEVAQVQSQPSDSTSSQEKDDPLNEMEVYYSSRVNTYLGELKAYEAQFPGIEEEITFDLAELDSAYSELKKDLKEDAHNEAVIQAMMENYKLKLMILEDILDQLKESENEDNHEISA